MSVFVHHHDDDVAHTFITPDSSILNKSHFGWCGDLVLVFLSSLNRLNVWEKFVVNGSECAIREGLSHFVIIKFRRTQVLINIKLRIK